jgi:hypothetical protein
LRDRSNVKIYKYREIDANDNVSLARFARIVHDGFIWCARPDTLDDPKEFAWTCDFRPSPDTLDVLEGLLQKMKRQPGPEARQRAQAVLDRGVLEALGRPVMADIVARVHDEVGVACFGSTADNEALWSRCAGGGRGVAIEIDVPDSLVGRHLHRVVYSDDRSIHIDDFIRSMDGHNTALGAYATLLTKTTSWSPEQEIRYLSKEQGEFHIDGSSVTGVVLGQGLSAEDIEAIGQMAAGVACEPRSVK